MKTITITVRHELIDVPTGTFRSFSYKAWRITITPAVKGIIIDGVLFSQATIIRVGGSDAVPTVYYTAEAVTGEASVTIETLTPNIQ